jgi:hypothetical protein
MMTYLKQIRFLAIGTLFSLLVIFFLGSSLEMAVGQEGFDTIYEPTEQNSILAAASQSQGLDALRKVLDTSSRATNSPAIREVLVQPPSEIPDIEGLDYRSELPGIVATAVFQQLVEHPQAPNDAALETFGRDGQRARLPEGGILHLRINGNRSPVSATIAVSGANIPGYERVRQMRFVLSE